MINKEELGFIKNNIRLAKKPREQLQIEADLHGVSVAELQNIIYESAPKEYSPEFKKKVLQSCEHEKATIVAIRYGIKAQTIYDWRKNSSDKPRTTAHNASRENETDTEPTTIENEVITEETSSESELQYNATKVPKDKLTAIEEIDLLFGIILSLCDRGIISKDFLPTENEAFLLGVHAGLEYAEKQRQHNFQN